MTTQLTNTSSSFAPVRFYTAADPYYYTVDNRPLTDLSANDVALAYAADASRMTASALNLGFGGFTKLLQSGFNKVAGLHVYKDAGGLWWLGKGVLAAPSTINNSTMASFGINQVPMPLTITPCIMAGNFKTHTVFVGLTAATSANAANVPFFDPGNPFLASDGILQQLQVAVVESGETTKPNTPVVPTAPAGYIPLYQIITYGADTTYYVRPLSGAQQGYDNAITLTPALMGAAPATLSTFAGRSMVQFPTASTTEVCYVAKSGINFVAGSELNLRLDFVQPNASGDNKLKISYAIFNDCGSLPATPTYIDVSYNLPNCSANILDSRIIPFFLPQSAVAAANYIVIKVARTPTDPYVTPAVAAQPLYLFDVSIIQ